jgi:hypothetical protein
VTMWRPAQRVVGAWAGGARVGRDGGVSVRLAAGEGARALACVLVATAGSSPGGLARRMQGRSGASTGCRSLALTPTRRPDVRLAPTEGALRRFVGVRFTADANLGRSTTMVVPVRR